MDEDTLNLAKRALDALQRDLGLKEYVEVSTMGLALNTLPVGNLLLLIEEYYDKAATLKSIGNFLEEGLGINKSRCILLLAIESDTIYTLVTQVIAEHTGGYYIARAKSLEEALSLVNYFNLKTQTCGLITEYMLSPDEDCYELLEQCENLPIMVLVRGSGTPTYIRLLAAGARAIIDSYAPNFEGKFLSALQDMFMEG